MTKKRKLTEGPKIVVIGGGTGVSVLLRGLKNYTENITAIVTVADDGGGSGVLREDLGMLPPGDIRACILALANTEPTMEKLMQFRFTEGKLRGQSFGNLLLAAMNEIYGSFERAVKELSNVLAVTGQVIPMTLEDVTLLAELSNGEISRGESTIPRDCLEKNTEIRKIYTDPVDCHPLEESLEAIDQAELIVLGPGSLYTSIIPNLLMVGIRERITMSNAPVVYISNVMTQPGETTGYTVSDHLNAILNHGNHNMIDYVIANGQSVDEEILSKYLKDGQTLVRAREEDCDYLSKLGIKLIVDDLVEIRKDYIRHDSLRLSEILLGLAKTRVYHRA